MDRNTASPFHAGEREVQARVGVQDKMATIGAAFIKDHLIKQHRLFYPLLPMIFVSFVDDRQQPWCSMLVGEPGFIESPDERHLLIRSRPAAGDPLNRQLAIGLEVGVLGIELPTRRRNRMNGVVERIDDDGILISVVQSFGNCPKYIQTRSHRFVETSPPTAATTFTRFDQHHIEFIGQSDTFFVASHAPDSGVDASHRGGYPGFISVDDHSTLTIPDYSGNNLFNTLGNFIANPRAGLLFPDFENGDLTLLTGDVEILWDVAAQPGFEGAQRLWQFRLTRGITLPGASTLRWTFGEYSPFAYQP